MIRKISEANRSSLPLSGLPASFGWSSTWPRYCSTSESCGHIHVIRNCASDNQKDSARCNAKRDYACLNTFRTVVIENILFWSWMSLLPVLVTTKIMCFPACTMTTFIVQFSSFSQVIIVSRKCNVSTSNGDHSLWCQPVWKSDAFSCQGNTCPGSFL